MFMDLFNYNKNNLYFLKDIAHNVKVMFVLSILDLQKVGISLNSDQFIKPIFRIKEFFDSESLNYNLCL